MGTHPPQRPPSSGIINTSNLSVKPDQAQVSRLAQLPQLAGGVVLTGDGDRTGRRPPGSGDYAADGVAGWCTTTTGHGAWATQYSPTDPSRISTSSPCPRLPTTSRSAPEEASTSSFAAGPSTKLDSRARPGWAFRTGPSARSSARALSAAGSRSGGITKPHP